MTWKRHDGAWNDPASLTKLREILATAQGAFTPDFNPDVPPDPVDPGRAVQWADTLDPSGDYREDALRLLGDPLAKSIIGVIHDAFVMQPPAKRVTAIIDDLQKDRDRLTRVLAVVERLQEADTTVPAAAWAEHMRVLDRAAALAKIRSSMTATLRAAADGTIGLTPQILRAIAEVIDALLHELHA